MISANPTVYSVSQLNSYVKRALDSDENLAHIFIMGEISNFKAHYSGHLYMTIKDDAAAVKAVMFAGNAARLRFKPENGLKVLIFGTVTLYQKDGSFQLYINDMQPDGLGALNLAFSQLKEKLSKEGLFEESRKKPLPLFPSRVGVITSATGAAIQDIISVLGRRFPAAEVIIKPVLVQGDNAAPDIANAIKLFNERSAADVLIVGRGGGSIEDLWAFNEEVVARAVADSVIPIISAVGHETDYTICDFAADLRAPTPSAAAELCVPDALELKSYLLSQKQHIFTLVKSGVSSEREHLSAIEKSGVLKNPLAKINDSREELSQISEKLISLSAGALGEQKNKLSVIAGKLDALSPLSVISRGYSIVYKDNNTITSVNNIKKGDNVSVRLSDGSFFATVENVNGEK